MYFQRIKSYCQKLISNHFEVSSREARVYLDIINMYPNGRKQVLSICKMYGLEESKVKEMCEY
jgi:predicted transcriptional regulator